MDVGVVMGDRLEVRHAAPHPATARHSPLRRRLASARSSSRRRRLRTLAAALRLALTPRRPQDYEIGPKIESGTYASVYRARCRLSNQLVAVKKIDCELMRAAGPDTMERIQREVEVHSRLSHRSIVRLLSTFKDGKHVYLVMELCDAALDHYLKTRVRLEEPEARELFSQLLDGVRYLHDHNIMHRDLKLANLLLCGTRHGGGGAEEEGGAGEGRRLKIADFGLAIRLGQKNDERTTMCGTPNYISPEIVANQPHSLETDVWSLGSILYTLLIGTPPFDSDMVHTTLAKVAHTEPQIPSFVSAEARDLVSRLLVKDPKRRISLADARHHSFMGQRSPSPDRRFCGGSGNSSSGSSEGGVRRLFAAGAGAGQARAFRASAGSSGVGGDGNSSSSAVWKARFARPNGSAVPAAAAAADERLSLLRSSASLRSSTSAGAAAAAVPVAPLSPLPPLLRAHEQQQREQQQGRPWPPERLASSDGIRGGSARIELRDCTLRVDRSTGATSAEFEHDGSEWTISPNGYTVVLKSPPKTERAGGGMVVQKFNLPNLPATMHDAYYSIAAGLRVAKRERAHYDRDGSPRSADVNLSIPVEGQSGSPQLKMDFHDGSTLEWSTEQSFVQIKRTTRSFFEGSGVGISSDITATVTSSELDDDGELWLTRQVKVGSATELEQLNDNDRSMLRHATAALCAMKDGESAASDRPRSPTRRGTPSEQPFARVSGGGDVGEQAASQRGEGEGESQQSSSDIGAFLVADDNCGFLGDAMQGQEQHEQEQEQEQSQELGQERERERGGVPAVDNSFRQQLRTAVDSSFGSVISGRTDEDFQPRDSRALLAEFRASIESPGGRDSVRGVNLDLDEALRCTQIPPRRAEPEPLEPFSPAAADELSGGGEGSEDGSVSVAATDYSFAVARQLFRSEPALSGHDCHSFRSQPAPSRRESEPEPQPAARLRLPLPMPESPRSSSSNSSSGFYSKSDATHTVQVTGVGSGATLKSRELLVRFESGSTLLLSPNGCSATITEHDTGARTEYLVDECSDGDGHTPPQVMEQLRGGYRVLRALRLQMSPPIGASPSPPRSALPRLQSAADRY